MQVSDNVVTYEEQILDENLPGSIIIGGSGAIGVEFAYVMKNFGVDVTIVEFLDRMVPTEDADVSKELLKHYKKLGVKVLLSTKVENVEDTGDRRPGHRQPGRRRGVAGARGRQDAGRLRLRAAGRGLRPRGRRRGAHRPRRDRGRRAAAAPTSTNVYAIGDVTGKMMLAHAAEAMGIVAAETIAGAETMRDRLRHDPAGDVLPAPDRLLRLQRGAGQGEGVRRQDRHVPVLGQRQGAWAWATRSAS